MRRALLLLALLPLPAFAQDAPTSPVTEPSATVLPMPALDDTSQAPATGGREPSAADRAYGALQRGLYLTALNLALPLAKLGDPTAQALVGEIYARGLGVARSDAEAARWYEAAAKAGSADGQFRFALMLLDGSAGRRDPAAAKEMMRKAADAGIPLAAYNYGQMLIQASPSGGFAEARPYFEQAAAAGVPDAQYAMAQVYAYGRGVEAPDPVKARGYLGAAAANGNELAQIEYGIWLINGKGGTKSTVQGANWLRRAAARGNPIAMNRLAHLYKDGIGVVADKTEAAKWSVLAKRADNTDATLDDFFRKLDEATKRAALEAANRFRAS